jgi:hypothetical protein
MAWYGFGVIVLVGALVAFKGSAKEKLLVLAAVILVTVVAWLLLSTWSPGGYAVAMTLLVGLAAAPVLGWLCGTWLVRRRRARL